MSRGPPFQKGGRHATSHHASDSNSLHGGLFRCDDGSPALNRASGPSSVTAHCGLARPQRLILPSEVYYLHEDC